MTAPATSMLGRTAPRVLLAAGGTGGHVYPAIAIADALRTERPDCRALFVGTRDRMEWQAVPAAGYPIRAVWISGLHRRLTLRNLLFPVKVLVSLVQSLLIVRGFRPDFVVGCGGFASGPVGWVAAKLGIPLFLHEQNCFPGVTTRLLAPLARRVYLTFPDEEGHFEPGKTQVVGNPTRSALLGGGGQSDGRSDEGEAGNPEASDPAVSSARWLQEMKLDPEAPTLLVLGGSGGAGSLNDAVLGALPSLTGVAGGRLQIVWQCGPAHEMALRERLEQSGADLSRVRLKGYIDRMPDAYHAATLVVCRAGAGTLSEVMLAGRAALAVPSPHVAGDHQAKNARHLERHGALQVLPENEAAGHLAERVAELIDAPDARRELARNALAMARPDAARTVAHDLLERTGWSGNPSDPTN